MALLFHLISFHLALIINGKLFDQDGNKTCLGTINKLVICLNPKVDDLITLKSPDEEIIYVHTEASLFVSRDHGKSFRGFTRRWIKQIIVNKNAVYVATNSGLVKITNNETEYLLIGRSIEKMVIVNETVFWLPHQNESANSDNIETQESPRDKRQGWISISNHCGLGRGTPDQPVLNYYDGCCYQHDRCLERNSWRGDMLCHGGVLLCFAPKTPPFAG